MAKTDPICFFQLGRIWTRTFYFACGKKGAGLKNGAANPTCPFFCGVLSGILTKKVRPRNISPLIYNPGCDSHPW